MPLFPQQIAAVERFRELPRALNLSPYGTGKSAAMVARLLDLCPPHRVLLVCPVSKIEEWITELRTWGSPSWVIQPLGGRTIPKRANRFAALARPHHIGIINPDGILVLGSALLGQYDVLCIDEIHAFRNPYAASSRAVAALSDSMAYCYGMTGSPLTEHLKDLYSTLRIINPNLVDATFEPWLQRHFEYESREVDGVRQYPKWHPREGTAETLAALLRSISYRCRREDLPITWPREIDAAPIRVRLTGSSLAAYYRMEQESQLSLRNVTVTADNIRPRLVKLLQISSGWIYNERKQPVAVGDSDKISALGDHLEEIRGTGRILIWATYPPEVFMIHALLKRMGLRHALAYGGTHLKDRDAIKDAFNRGGLDVMVASPEIWGAGVNLYADYCTTFSRSWSGEEHSQKRGRPIRADSTQSAVVFTEMVTTGTVDETVLWALSEKRDLVEEILRLRDLRPDVASASLARA